MMTGEIMDGEEAAPMDATSIVGGWIPCTWGRPDDELAVLVWSEDLDDWTVAYHDSDRIEQHGTGWVDVIDESPVHGVTHWCSDVTRPGIR